MPFCNQTCLSLLFSMRKKLFENELKNIFFSGWLRERHHVCGRQSLQPEDVITTRNHRSAVHAAAVIAGIVTDFIILVVVVVGASIVVGTSDCRNLEVISA